MPYAILRFAKRKAGAVSAVNKHNERLKEAYKSNKDIDPARTPLNYHLQTPSQSYYRVITRLTEQAGCKRRKDSVVMVETLITASPEFLKGLPPQEQKAYFLRAFEFIKERIGQQNILSAVVHMDERTPHMHLSFCPITKDNRLAAKDILGNPKQISQWQTDFHAHMSERWSELERGISAIETGRKHIPVWLYKKAERLDERAQAIDAALSDINAFNAGKKRDKALELLREWIPQAQEFTTQIKGYETQTKGLETALRQESQLAVTFRDAAVKAEYENEAARKEAFMLKRQLERQQRLLERVPDDLWKQINHPKTERHR